MSRTVVTFAKWLVRLSRRVKDLGDRIEVFGRELEARRSGAPRCATCRKPVMLHGDSIVHAGTFRLHCGAAWSDTEVGRLVLVADDAIPPEWESRLGGWREWRDSEPR